MGVRDVLASLVLDDTGLTVLSPEPRAGQRPKRNLLTFLSASREQRKRSRASMPLISRSPEIVIVATPIRFVGSLVILVRERIDCKGTNWLTFQTNAALSNPGEVL
jgi:hypothetical protein